MKSRPVFPVQRLIVLAAFALAGCASIGPGPQTSPFERPRPEPGTYSVVSGQEPELVAQLRAAPPPDAPEIIEGKTAATDERALEAKSFVRIGDADYDGDPAAGRAWIEKQGRRVGAEKVYIYASSAGSPTLHAAFYVRYRLPFGATFRETTASEQQTLGSSGVQLGQIVSGTPASEANLIPGDFVVKFDGRPVRGKADFQEQLRANMGKRVTLTINRNGQTLERMVRLGVAPGSLHPKDK
ncbi:MAG TPA: PDZ domain-containing protein [Rudaea sp.]